jgi:hypothetical protein
MCFSEKCLAICLTSLKFIMSSENKFTKLKLQKTENSPSRDTTGHERTGGAHQLGDCLPYTTTIKQRPLFREGLVEDVDFLIDLLRHLQKTVTWHSEVYYLTLRFVIIDLFSNTCDLILAVHKYVFSNVPNLQKS